MRSIEICAGGGGEALGLERAGFKHIALIESDSHACATLFANRPNWNIMNCDVTTVDWTQFSDIDLFTGGTPCPPFSKAGKQLGESDERELYGYAVDVAIDLDAKAIMLENVRGLMDPKFEEYRERIEEKLKKANYKVFWKLLKSSDFGVPQLRPRSILIALKLEYAPFFNWPEPQAKQITVGEAIGDLMGSDGWPGVKEWVKKANKVAPTIVGGSKKHGGPDLGPTRAKKEWKKLGVNGLNVMYDPPSADFVGTKEGYEGLPYLSLRMVARLQGFPDEWEFPGKKTNVYRQIGNAFPPPLAEELGRKIVLALSKNA
jgi:DNA (cytosine-5)-methyltransferase 1